MVFRHAYTYISPFPFRKWLLLIIFTRDISVSFLQCYQYPEQQLISRLQIIFKSKFNEDNFMIPRGSTHLWNIKTFNQGIVAQK